MQTGVTSDGGDAVLSCKFNPHSGYTCVFMCVFDWCLQGWIRSCTIGITCGSGTPTNSVRPLLTLMRCRHQVIGKKIAGGIRQTDGSGGLWSSISLEHSLPVALTMDLNLMPHCRPLPRAGRFLVLSCSSLTYFSATTVHFKQQFI